MQTHQHRNHCYHKSFSFTPPPDNIDIWQGGGSIPKRSRREYPWSGIGSSLHSMENTRAGSVVNKHTRSTHAYVHAYRNILKAKHITVHKYNTVVCKHICIGINVITSHSLSRSFTILWESGSKSAGEPNPRLSGVRGFGSQHSRHHSRGDRIQSKWRDPNPRGIQIRA